MHLKDKCRTGDTPLKKEAAWGPEWASSIVCGSGFTAATTGSTLGSLAETCIKNMYIKVFRRGQEISLCGYPARSIIQLPWPGLLWVSPSSLCWAPTLQLVPLLLGQMLPSVPFWLPGQIFCWHPSRNWGMVTGLPSTFTPSPFSDFGRKSTIYWSLVHSAYSILQGGLSRPWVSSSPSCPAIRTCVSGDGADGTKTRNSMNIGLTDLIVVCLTHSTVNELW